MQANPIMPGGGFGTLYPQIETELKHLMFSSYEPLLCGPFRAAFSDDLKATTLFIKELRLRAMSYNTYTRRKNALMDGGVVSHCKESKRRNFWVMSSECNSYHTKKKEEIKCLTNAWHG